MSALYSFGKVTIRLWRKRWAGISIAVIGLAIALAVSFLSALYVHDGIRSDNWLPEADKLYRAATKSQNTSDTRTSVLASYKLRPKLDDKFSELEASVRLYPRDIEASVNNQSDSQRWVFVDPSFPDIFELPMLAGSISETFTAPNKVLLSEKVAS